MATRLADHVWKIEEVVALLSQAGGMSGLPSCWWRVTAAVAACALVLGLLWIIVKREFLFGAIWLVLFGAWALVSSVYWLRRRRSSN
jgi:hypothetical protein